MSYEARDVEKILGIKRNCLEQWLEGKFVEPSIQSAKGYGSRNVWSLNNLYGLEFFRQITEQGLSRKLVGKFLKAGKLNESKLDNVRYLVYVNKKDINEEIKCRVFTDDDLIDLNNIQKDLGMEDFDNIFIVNFNKIMHTVNEKIKKI